MNFLDNTSHIDPKLEDQKNREYAVKLVDRARPLA